MITCTSMEAVQICEAPNGFDRIEYARRHRYRLRNLRDGGLGICLFFKSGRSVASANAEITGLDGRVTQEGDCELAGWPPVAALDAALKLIRVSKLKPGNENFAPHRKASGS